jgi:hypothetical protein
MMKRLSIPIAAAALACLGACTSEPDVHPQASGPATFDTLTAAVQRLAAVAAAYDPQSIEDLFGPEGPDLLSSGDEVADREDARHLAELIAEKVDFEDHSDGRKVALLGDERWPLPIPLVHAGGGWRFDAEAGQEEVENRRVGRNELSTIATLHAYVDAQREYASKGRDGLPACYARRVFSSAGKHDGLYWPPKEGEEESPFGPFVAEAAADGYAESDGGPRPFHGYRFRILTEQGEHAPGGARKYVGEDGRMTRGFAMVAWPAKYGSSGVMTFQVDQRGIVYQKDLGEETEAAAAKITSFDVDSSWDPTGD